MMSQITTFHDRYTKIQSKAAWNSLENQSLCTFSTVYLLQVTVVPSRVTLTFELQLSGHGPKTFACIVRANSNTLPPQIELPSAAYE